MATSFHRNSQTVSAKKSFVSCRWPHNASKKPECYIISERTWCCTAPATW
nr:unnamed protein product [Callosobruchus analis]